MPILDSNGLSDGDRINSCSKMAQLYYPRMMAASNGYGRIRIDYRLIVAMSFPRWAVNDLPTESELLGYFQEYAHHRLIFLYQSAGQLWGQWDARAGTFGKYQTVIDKRSAAPPEHEFEAWIKENREHSHKPSVAMAHFELSVPPETLRKGSEKFPQVSESLPHGIGVGIGEGIRCEVLGVNNPSRLRSKVDSIFEKAYEQYPRHVGKRAAEKSWAGAVGRASEKVPEAEEMIYQRVIAFALVCKRTHREQQYIPHMNTWLNQDRFLDDPTEWAVAGQESKLPHAVPRAPVSNAAADAELERQLGHKVTG